MLHGERRKGRTLFQKGSLDVVNFLQILLIDTGFQELSLTHQRQEEDDKAGQGEKKDAGADGKEQAANAAVAEEVVKLVNELTQGPCNARAHGNRFARLRVKLRAMRNLSRWLQAGGGFEQESDTFHRVRNAGFWFD